MRTLDTRSACTHVRHGHWPGSTCPQHLDAQELNYNNESNGDQETVSLRLSLGYKNSVFLTPFPLRKEGSTTGQNTDMMGSQLRHEEPENCIPASVSQWKRPGPTDLTVCCARLAPMLAQKPNRPHQRCFPTSDTFWRHSTHGEDHSSESVTRPHGTQKMYSLGCLVLNLHLHN